MTMPSTSATAASVPEHTAVPDPDPAPASVSAPLSAPPPASQRPPDLPGCEPLPLPASELDTFEYRLEVWDGRTETAWVCEPVTIYHEQPARRLSWVTSRIALMRGSPIRCIGSADLVQRNAAGRERWIMQADEVLYLHPGRARVSKRVVEVDANDLPDVVLEVDHTTDVRQWKLGMYQEWGFPEIWVLVPWEESVREPGMTIHVRGTNGGYREVRESVAFPGWTAEENHTALTEEPLSAETYGVLERVGRALGAREGTRPEDDPFARSLSARARAEGRERGHATGYAQGRTEGHATGYTEGRAKGRTEGHAEVHAEAVLAVLRARGIDAAGLVEDPGFLVGLPLDASMAAAVACTGEADLRRRLRAASRTGGDG